MIHIDKLQLGQIVQKWDILTRHQIDKTTTPAQKDQIIKVKRTVQM